ncbi:MAG TPA: PmoA family protein [Candidatus Paceibacterota bacterium]|nr:PmoA family protein [Verrucomicrobiota bacterium]HRY50112.1 PmoA family protein [Candidatus Paceibacterota bacterium]
MSTADFARIRSFSAAAFLIGVFLFNAGFSSRAAVEIKDQGASLRIEIDGQLFTEYHYQNVPRPYFYPVLGPGSLAMTRNWPMKVVPDEEQDHPHHKSLWFTHGSVNGVDFWSDGANKGRIVHDAFVAVQSGPEAGLIHQKVKWITAEGKLLLNEDRILRIQPRSAHRFLDWEFTLIPVDGDVVLGDTKEGSMAIRLAETMRLKGKVGKGHIVNSRGVRDGDTWGKRAEWCDYYGPVNGQVVGVAIFDHPGNPRHPTWWHVRDYGLFAANPFGIHDFEKKPAGTGDLTIKAGERVTFRYRFYFHQGDEKEGQVERQYREYVNK